MELYYHSIVAILVDKLSVFKFDSRADSESHQSNNNIIISVVQLETLAIMNENLNQ